MRHSKWLVLASLSLFGAACNCDTVPPTLEQFGEGNFVVRDSSGAPSYVHELTADFGPVLVETRVERKIVLKNTGAGGLQVDTVAKDEAFNPAFTFDAASVTLNPGEEREYTLVFEPKLEGEHLGTVTFNLKGSVSGNEKLVLTIQGRGVKTGCTISPAETVDFGTVATGGSFSQLVKVFNASELDWEVKVDEILSDTDKGAFSFVNFTAGNAVVPAHGELTIRIEFRPNHLGAHHAALSIVALNSDTACQPSVLPLVGNGVDQVLECKPKILTKDPTTGKEVYKYVVDFGYVNPGSTALGQAECTNLGNEDITLSEVTLFQDPNKGTAFKLEGERKLVVAKGQTVALPLSYTPTQLGRYLGTMTFLTSDVKLPKVTFNLQGTGGGPKIDVQPPRVDFGPVAVGTYQRRRVTVANVGSDVPGTLEDNLLVMAPYASGKACLTKTECGGNPCLRGVCWSQKAAVVEMVSGTEGEVTIGSFDGYVAAGIASGQSVTMKITFSPTSPGEKLAKVKIYSTDQATPEKVFEVGGTAQTMPPCDYALVPPLVAFGVTEPGKTQAQSFFIRNKATDPANECYVSTLNLSASSHSSFALVDGPIDDSSPAERKKIKGGESMEIPIRFSPKAEGSYSATVEFFISSVDAPEGSEPVSGTSATGCLLIAPNEVDFGVIQVGCGSRLKPVTIYNICPNDQTLETIDLQNQHPEFSIAQKPLPNYLLKAGASVDFKVKYSPTDVGNDKAVVAIKTAQMAQPFTVPMGGRGDTTAIQTDVFAQDPQPKVDVLFVIDSSGSMYNKQTNLGNNFQNFIKFADVQQVDYHIAVTTTGVDEAHGNENGGCSSCSDPDMNGCFVPPDGSRPKVITNNTPDAKNVFKQNVYVGTSGHYNEMLIRPAYLALTNPNLQSCNKDFLRDDANLAVVVVSDAGDQDDEVVSFYTNALLTIKGFKRQNMFSFNGIIPLPPYTGTCSYDGSHSGGQGERVPEIVNATGGVKADICTDNWALALEKLGQNAFGYRTRFFLTNTPDLTPPYEVKVQIDGEDYAAIGPHGEERWAYNSGANAVDFNVLAVPEPGSTITVAYHVACLQ